MLSRWLSWGAVLSPAFFLIWIAYTARAGPLGYGTLSLDPPGYREKLEAYAPFVRACRDLANATTPEQREHQLKEAIALASPGLPHLEAVELGVSASEDLRRPIINARDVVMREVVRRLESALARKNYEEAAHYSLSYARLAWVLRYGDPTTLMVSSLHLNSAIRYLQEILPHLGPDTLADVSQGLLEMEHQRRPLLLLIKRDLTLLEDALVSLKTTPNYQEALVFASTGVRRAAQGDFLDPLINLVSRTLEGKARYYLWTTLSAWRGMIESEVNNQRSLRSLLAHVRFLEIKKKGQKVEDFYELGLPRFARIDPLTGEPAPIRITQTGAQFLFVPSGIPKLALEDHSADPENPSL